MALTRITVRQLEAFVAVARSLSFAAASQELGLSPSAVSQLISELEGAVGFRLFDRTTRRVALSGAGREMLGHGQATMRSVMLLESYAADIRSRAAGVVRIGAPLVLASMCLPGAVHAFCETRPKVVIYIRDVAVEALVDSVEVGEIDLAIGPDRPPSEAVVNQPVFSSPWVLWCAPEHPLAAPPRLRWADLHDADLVAAGRDHEVSVAQMRRSASARAIVPADVVENVSTALGIAAQGRVATLSPAYVGALAYTLGLEMRQVCEPEVIREVCLYRSAQRSVPPAAEAFSEFLFAWAQRWNAGIERQYRRVV